MLWTFFFALLVLWVFGIKSANTMGGMVHVLLLIAIGAAFIRIIQGRRPV